MTDPRDPARASAVPLRPAHPERTCWGCPRYCPADDLGCANGTVRTMHPIELFGDDWAEWIADRDRSPDTPTRRG